MKDAERVEWGVVPSLESGKPCKIGRLFIVLSFRIEGFA